MNIVMGIHVLLK